MSLKLTFKAKSSGFWGSVRSYSSGLAWRGIIVGGWIYAPQNKYYQNFIYLSHYYLWFMVVMLLVLFLGMAVIASKASEIKPSDTSFASAATMKKTSQSWIYKNWFRFVDIPTLLFIGVFMYDSSLLVAMGLYVLLGYLSVSMGAEVWNRIPESIKKTPEMAAALKEVEDSAKNPIQVFKEELNEKRAAEVAAAEAVAEEVLEGEESD